LNLLLYFYEVQYEGYAIEGNHNAILLMRNLSHLKVMDVYTSEVDVKLAVDNVGQQNFVC
jgi:hypothetical protein